MTSSLLLVALSLAVFIVFVNSTTRLIRITHIISAVADETRDAIEQNYPHDDRYVTIAGAPDLGEPSGIVRAELSRRPLLRQRGGVVLGVDAGTLVELAGRHDCVLRLIPRIGEYVGQDAPVVEAHGGRCPPPAHVQSAVQLGRERTLYQDPAYGIRQLVDIAAQALSPAINAPTTAVQVIDRLTDLVARIARRPDPTGLVVDRELRLRLVVRVPAWSELVELAFTEIRTFGARSPQVARRLVASLEDLLADLPEERRPPLERQLALLLDAVSPHDVEPIADRMGLG